jgi:hypothetical protein
LKDAPLMFQKPGLPADAVNMIHELPLREGGTRACSFQLVSYPAVLKKL